MSSTICLAFLLRWTHALLHDLDGVHFPSNLRPRSPRSAGRFTRRALCGASSSCRRPTASFAASPFPRPSIRTRIQTTRKPHRNSRLWGVFNDESSKLSKCFGAGQVFRIFLSSDEMCKYDAIYCIYQTEMTHFEPLVVTDMCQVWIPIPDLFMIISVT